MKKNHLIIGLYALTNFHMALAFVPLDEVLSGSAYTGYLPKDKQLTSGQYIYTTADSSKCSGFSGYYAIMQADGNLVLYGVISGTRFGKALWSSNTKGKSNPELILWSDKNQNGVFFICDTQTCNSKTLTDQPSRYKSLNLNIIASKLKKPDRLQLNPDGNLVIYDGSQQPLWATNTESAKIVVDDLNKQFTGHKYDGLVDLSDSDHQSAILQTGDYIHTMANKNNKYGYSDYYAVMQNDHNFVVYGALTVKQDGVCAFSSGIQSAIFGNPLWSSGTPYSYRVNDPSFIQFTSTSIGIFAYPGTGTSFGSFSNAARLQLNPDGNLVVYNLNDNPLWATGSNQAESN